MKPPDHAERMKRALLSLDGLSVGDAFGECFFGNPRVAERRMAQRDPPPPPWPFTDDTAMALSVTRGLYRTGNIDQDALAKAFAAEYYANPRRGYGAGAHKILRAIYVGEPWRDAAGAAFGGQGSCGNGGAMRSGPIGAYFAEQVDQVISEAKASAEVTHAHPDGQAGAIAVALAAAWAASEANRSAPFNLEMIRFVLRHLPGSETGDRLEKALELPLEIEPSAAASILGNGSRVIASDTVPFCLWSASRHPRDFKQALWSTVSVGGDIDTNCAIVGGIVSVSAGKVPGDWLAAREPFRF
jgi:ADP-ribosylglycohydrolase